jgi:CRISPR/Cas system-associated exonuclease Cas4 (RecB family)
VLDSYPEMTPVVRLHYLADGTTVDVDENPRYEPGRIAKYEDAIDGILSRAFPPEPQSSETCLSCQFLFVCPRRDITSEPT